MIEYDYIIKRNEEDEVVTYIPDKIPKQLPNLVYIEGPNSSGKSTLLHMIALSLHGLNKENMNPALKHKMESLLYSSYQDVKFEFKIQNVDKTLEIISHKDDPTNSQIIVYEVKNGKKVPISADKFERDYNLIYDIPEDPTQRLKQMTESIKWLQQSWGNRARLLVSNIQKVSNDVKNSKDPKRIQELEGNLIKANQVYRELLDKNNQNKVFLDMLEKYTYCRSFLDYNYQYDRINKKIGNLEKEKKKVIKNKKKISKEHEGLTNEAYELLEILEAKYDEATPTLKRLLPKENDHLIKIWEMVNFKDALKNLEFSEKFKKVNLTFKWELINITEKHEETIKEAEKWQKIIDVLQEFKAKDTEVPGIGKKISEFIIVLIEANQEYEELLNYISNIKKLIELLNNIEEKRVKLETDIFPRLLEISYDQEFEWCEDEIDTEDVYEKEMEKLEKIFNIYEFYQKECAKKDISLDDIQLTFKEISAIEELIPYESYLENQLLEKINHLSKSISEENTNLKKRCYNIKSLETEIERLEKKEPHKYQNKTKELTDLSNTCLKLQQKLLVNYAKYIDEVITGIYSSNSKDKERDKYFEQISYYLGKRIGYIKYIEKEYKVKSIDMVHEIIQTEEGKIIHLTDMGTGQSQSAYLMGQLNVSDNRKIIALFDEVAMMDKKSLSPIFTKLEELYREDKLLLGVVVQMGNDLKVTEIGS